MTIRVETASMRCLERLYEIERECFDIEAFSKTQIRNLLTNYDSIALQARENGNIAGFIIGDIQHDRDITYGRIITIDVAVGFRRRGIGLRLLKEMEEIFTQKRAAISRLEVKENNLAALALYHKRGYAKIATLKNYYGSTNGFLLTKKLA